MRENTPDAADRRKGLRRVIIIYLIAVVVTAAVMMFVYEKILISSTVLSESMENTLMTGDRYIGNRLAYTGEKTPERYDVVLFYYPDDENLLYVKRVIGLPGEKVTVRNGEVYIDDTPEPLEDSFIREEMDKEDEREFMVPAGHYFMLGDNRNSSWDSRYWDNPYVSEDKIVGKALFRWWKGFRIIR